MSRTVEKQVHLLEQTARRLEELAASRGTTEEAIIQQALEKMFCEQEPSAQFMADRELLRQLEAEVGPVKPNFVPTIDPADIVSVDFPIYLDPSRIKREAHGQ